MDSSLNQSVSAPKRAFLRPSWPNPKASLTSRAQLLVAGRNSPNLFYQHKQIVGPQNQTPQIRRWKSAWRRLVWKSGTAEISRAETLSGFGCFFFRTLWLAQKSCSHMKASGSWKFFIGFEFPILFGWEGGDFHVLEDAGVFFQPLRLFGRRSCLCRSLGSTLSFLFVWGRFRVCCSGRSGSFLKRWVTCEFLLGRSGVCLTQRQRGHVYSELFLFCPSQGLLVGPCRFGPLSSQSPKTAEFSFRAHNRVGKWRKRCLPNLLFFVASGSLILQSQTKPNTRQTSVSQGSTWLKNSNNAKTPLKVLFGEDPYDFCSWMALAVLPKWHPLRVQCVRDGFNRSTRKLRIFCKTWLSMMLIQLLLLHGNRRGNGRYRARWSLSSSLWHSHNSKAMMSMRITSTRVDWWFVVTLLHGESTPQPRPTWMLHFWDWCSV